MSSPDKLDKQINPRIRELMDIILETRFSDLDKDYEACLELLDISKEENDSYATTFAYAYLGDCLVGINEIAKAEENLLKARELCERYDYIDLLPYLFTWLGICCEAQNDRQMAMNYYLDALELTKKNGDIFRQSVLYNNIASQFHNSNNYEMAKKYYINSFDTYRQTAMATNHDPHYAQLSANIISACCSLNEIDLAKEYYENLKNSDDNEDNRAKLTLCLLMIASKEDNIKVIHECVEGLLKDFENMSRKDRQFFATFSFVAEAMIELDEQEYALKILNVLDELCKDVELMNQLAVLTSWIKYYEKFGAEQEKNRVYKQFYKLRQLSDAMLKKNLSDGLLSKVRLRESIARNEEFKKEKEIFEEAAMVDELTNLGNRRLFRKKSDQLLKNNAVDKLGIIMIDIDYFKQYNDTYGHAKGDEILRSVATCIQETLSCNVYNFRYGGDEFVSITENLDDNEVNELLNNLKNTLKNMGVEHSASLCSDIVTLSIGYSVHQQRADENIFLPDLINEADKALYRAKKEGRNCICRYLGE